MSKQQKGMIVLAAAVVGQVLIGKFVKQQAAALGVSAVAVSVGALVVGAALA